MYIGHSHNDNSKTTTNFISSKVTLPMKWSVYWGLHNLWLIGNKIDHVMRLYYFTFFVFNCPPTKLRRGNVCIEPHESRHRAPKLPKPIFLPFVHFWPHPAYCHPPQNWNFSWMTQKLRIWPTYNVTPLPPPISKPNFLPLVHFWPHPEYPSP